MEFVHEFVFFGALMVALSVLAGMFSARLGVPLLLVFLVLGMLAGADGPGGFVFDDFRIAFLVGSVALALILFDGGLKTDRRAFRIALWPALSLSTVGVLATALVVAAIAVLVLGLDPLEGFLLGAVLASTDAAAVFLLLHGRGTEIGRRVSATLEAESGINDPMAVFLTVLSVELLLDPALEPSWYAASRFAVQMLGGAALGLAGGYLLLRLVNGIVIAAGLYPILAAAAALAIFAGANAVGASGFLAVYLAGLVMGRTPHRAQQVIARFHDGLVWLAQIVMFLLLGLLARPAALSADPWAYLAVAGALILVARPVAVWLSLLPFRFDWRQRTFIAWVGLRGAVPIFLASIPVLAGVPEGRAYFDAAFVAVLLSLVVQGWTVAPAARLLGLEVPPPPEPLGAGSLELPVASDREIRGYRVSADSPAAFEGFAALPLPERTRVLAVIREGAVLARERLDRLAAGDYVMLLAPPEHLITLDRLFAGHGARAEPAGLGEFVFDGGVPLAALADQYGLPFAREERHLTLGQFLFRRLGGQAAVGDRLKLGDVELVVREADEHAIMEVGLELESEAERLPLVRLWRRLIGRRVG